MIRNFFTWLTRTQTPAAALKIILITAAIVTALVIGSNLIAGR